MNEFRDVQREYTESQALKIKVLVMDVDGTLTDGTLFVSELGEEFKAFNVKDGYGIRVLLEEKGILPVIMTGKKSKIVEQRCLELGITQVFQGVEDKLSTVKWLLEQLSLTSQNIAFIGDDDNDLEAMRFVKLAGCPADASNNVKRVSHYISSKNGGKGAVREFIEWIIENKHL